MTAQTIDQVTTFDFPGLETFTDSSLNDKLRRTEMHWNFKGVNSNEAINSQYSEFDFAQIDIRRLKRLASSDS